MFRSRLRHAWLSRPFQQNRSVTPEALEERRLFAAVAADPGSDPAADPPVDNNPPQVVAVYVNGSTWTDSFRTALEAKHKGSALFGAETDSVNAEAGQNFREHVLGWVGINQVSIQFDEDVSVQQDDLTITGVNQATYAPTAFAYDAEHFTATWTLPAPVNNDVLTIRLEGSDATGVTDLAGNPLQGNCKDADEPANPLPVEGNPGRDYCELLPILAGDVTRDGVVNARDLGLVKAHLNARSTGPSSDRYDVFADANGDGAINALDLALVKQRLNSRLPASSAAAILGA
jgi:hypothetical protein